MPPEVEFQRRPPSTCLSGTSPLPSPDMSVEHPAAVPAGYDSSSAASVSSLSIGGLTNDLSDLDDLREMASVTAGFPQLSEVSAVRFPQPTGEPDTVPRHGTVTTTSGQVHQPPPVYYFVPPPPLVLVVHRNRGSSAATAAARSASGGCFRPASSLHTFPQSTPDFQSDQLIRDLALPPQPGQLNAVRLAVAFGVGLLRHTSEQLLRDVSAAFGHLEHADFRDILAFIADQLDLLTM